MAVAAAAGRRTPCAGLCMTGLLASIRSADEALIALHGGADIIDCKEPADGALGALPARDIRAVVAVVGGKRPVSATTGRPAPDARALREQIEATADCGVDMVKFGLYDSDAASQMLAAVRPGVADLKLVAVCFADRYDPNDLLPQLADAGVYGAMLDTHDKHAGSLTECRTRQWIAGFVDAAHSVGLVCGLAGRLRSDDIARLLPIGADYLGFRSALCVGDRAAGIDPDAVARVRRRIPTRTTKKAPRHRRMEAV